MSSTYVSTSSFVLSVYPTTRGFAFVLFEGPESPFDWGTKEFRGRDRNSRTLAAITDLIERYRPEVLVIEDFAAKGTRRSLRIRNLYRALVHVAETEFVDLVRVSAQQVNGCFASIAATGKREIAEAIARHIPAFASRLPPIRKAWMSEDTRQNLFDAAALGIAYYASLLRPEHDTPPRPIS